MWQKGVACVVKGGHAWQVWGGACMAGGACVVGGMHGVGHVIVGRHVWWRPFMADVGGMHGSGHVWWGGMHGVGHAFVGRHVWQGAFMMGARGEWGHAWWGACMASEMANTADGTHPTGMHSCIDQSFTEFIRGSNIGNLQV